jgi:hypothetical protein
MPQLQLDVTADATAAAASLDSVGAAARGMATDVESAAASADGATSKLDGLGDAGDNVASKSSQATGALGALAGGLDAIGATGAAAALEGTAIATDVMSGAGDALNLVMETQAGKFIVAKAQMVASTAASAAQATATGVATAAQWLWNAALTANPIGLVVAGVALFVGGIALAYAKVGPFRELVDGAFGAIKDAVDGVWKAIETAVGWVKDLTAGDLWDGLGNLVQLYFTPLTTAVGLVSDAIEIAVGWVKDLIDYISQLDFPDLPGWVPGADRNARMVGGKPTAGGDSEQWNPANYVSVALTVAPQDQDKAMSDLLDSLREFMARRGQTLSVTAPA